MNLPNKLTVARTILVPLFLVLLLIPSIPYNYLLSCIVFAAASLTDYYDGKIARARNMVTTFGKFLDPLADKILVTGALVAFVALGLASPVAVIIIIIRDYMVSAIRLLAVSSDGTVVSANWWGKVKTALQMTAIIGILLACQMWGGNENTMSIVQRWSCIVMWILSVYTLFSGFIYLYQNKHLVNSYR